MSRSYKKYPVHAVTTAKSKKEDCQYERMKKYCRRKLNEMEDPFQNEQWKKLRHSWVWDPRDGKRFRDDSDMSSREWYKRFGK